MNQPRTSARRDEGLILPLTLVLTVVIGAVVMSITSYASTSLRYGRVVESRVNRLAAADGGMRLALEQLRTKSPCASPMFPANSVMFNGLAPTVSCARTQMLATDAGQFAIVITASGVPAGQDAWLTQGVASQPRKVGGNVYLAVPPASIQKLVSITDGDIWYKDNNGSCVDPNYPTVTFKPVDERGYICTTDTWQTLFPIPTLPAVPNGNTSPTGRSNNNGCVVFGPGRYTSPPIISSGSQNFFKPGTYYFDWNNSSTPFSVKNAMVIAGVSSGGGTPPGTSNTDTTLSAPWCQSEINKASGGGGVTFVFGGNSRLSIEPNGQVEIFAPAGSTTDAIKPSIVALQSGEPTQGYNANTLGSTGLPLVDLQEGSATGFVNHGRVWAPTNGIVLGNIAQAANGQFLGGVVLGRFDMQAAANTGNFNIRVPTKPATKKLVLTSTVGATSISVVALVRASTGSFSVNSWRVQ